ncbi:MAG: nitroreductase/quinone reductase family protein [Acidimicrobiia bacterium]|nr:nitroreductase/quinone reductase family protein [Acidimicrobiia bacterium]
MDLLRPLQPVQLTTMGRRTGRPHTVTLLASPFEAGLVVTTCMGRDPDWIRNLRRNAHATVVADDSTFPVVGSFPVGLDRTNAVAAFCASRNRLIAAMTRRLVSGEAQTCPDMVVLSPC